MIVDELMVRWAQLQLSRVRVWLGRRGCRRGRHVWAIETVSSAGVAIAVPRCKRCARVDVDRIVTTVWNRDARRKWRRALRRA